MPKRTLKRLWFKYVAVWNRIVISTALFIVWLFVLTPTALIRRFLKKTMPVKSSRDTSFLKKSPPVSSDHWTQPF